MVLPQQSELPPTSNGLKAPNEQTSIFNKTDLFWYKLFLQTELARLTAAESAAQSVGEPKEEYVSGHIRHEMGMLEQTRIVTPQEIINLQIQLLQTLPFEEAKNPQLENGKVFVEVGDCRIFCSPDTTTKIFCVQLMKVSDNEEEYTQLRRELTAIINTIGSENCSDGGFHSHVQVI